LQENEDIRRRLETATCGGVGALDEMGGGNATMEGNVILDDNIDIDSI
jgi:hypothetical protein